MEKVVVTASSINKGTKCNEEHQETDQELGVRREVLREL